MANLNSLFNQGMGALVGNTGNYGGLLADDEVKAAQQQAQMAMAAQLLEAGGWSPQRTSVGQALGRGMQAAGQARQGAVDQSLRSALLRKQMAAQEDQDVKAIIDPATGKPKFVRTKDAVNQEPFFAMQRSEAPAILQEYAQYSKDEETAGRKPKSYMDWLPTRSASMAQSPFQVVDIGGGKFAFDRRTSDRSQLTTPDQEAEGAATIASATQGAKTTAEQTAQAAFDLPRVEQNTTNAISTLKELRNHRGLGSITGLYSLAPVIPGTDQAAADALAKQVEGKVFLEAFNTLKGGGVITDIEGKKATDAISRLQRAQRKEDYQRAVDDLVSVLENGVKLARKKASGSKPSSKSAEAGSDPLGIR